MPVRRCRVRIGGIQEVDAEFDGAVGDVAHPSWRASAVGVYRLWRDAGFAVGALVTGIIADLINPAAAIWTVALLTAASGGVVAIRMRETHHAAIAAPSETAADHESG